MSKIELSEKEQYILWIIVCWFDRPLVTSVLKHKLYPGSGSYKHMSGKYDTAIDDRIIQIGKWLEERRKRGQ